MDEAVAATSTRRHHVLSWVVGGLAGCGILVLVLWKLLFVMIMPGEVGVLYSVFFGGTVNRWTYGEGLAVKLPWDRIYVLERRAQAPIFTVRGLSRDGMPVDVEAMLYFRLKSEFAPNVLSEMGLDYPTRFLLPMAQGAVREVLSHYSTQELYAVEFKQLHDDLLAVLAATEFPFRRYFTSPDVSVRRLDLPAEIIAAIHRKLTAEQEMVAYRFHLERQRQEAERLKIEAMGVRTYNAIVQESLTDQLLTWRGIEATVQLARSNNAKVVIVGGHKDQLPLILGGDLGAAPPVPAPSPPPAAASAVPVAYPDGQSP